MTKPPVDASEVAAEAQAPASSTYMAAVSEDLINGTPLTPEGLGYLARYHAQADPSDQYWEVMGGQPGAWFAAMCTPSVPSRYRTPEMDSWALRLIAVAAPEVRTYRQVGAITPKPLAALNSGNNQLETRAHAAITQLIEEALARLLRSAGVQVLASFKDESLRSVFASVDICGVVRAAHMHPIRPGVMAMTVSTVDLEALVERARSALAVDLEELLGRIQTEARDLVAAQLGTVDLATTLDVPAAVALALSLFTEQARRALDPEPIPSSIDLEIGETGTSKVGAGLASGILSAAVGGAVGRGLGQFVGNLLTRSVLQVPQSAPPEARDIAAQVVSAQARITNVLSWSHGKFGGSSQPFPPHERLDGVDVDSAEWEAGRFADFEYTVASGETRSTPPFHVSGWFPGDHLGCTCGYDSRLELTLL
jgi:hypothetical protein